VRYPRLTILRTWYRPSPRLFQNTVFIFSIPRGCQGFDIKSLPFDIDQDPIGFDLAGAIPAVDHGVPDPISTLVNPVRDLQEDRQLCEKIAETYDKAVGFCLLFWGGLVVLYNSKQSPGTSPHIFGGLQVFFADHSICYNSSSQPVNLSNITAPSHTTRQPSTPPSPSQFNQSPLFQGPGGNSLSGSPIVENKTVCIMNHK
jgi:hypothetical protein